MRSQRTLLRQALVAIPLALGSALVSAVELDVPAQSLDAALTDFAEQANVRLLYDAALTRNSAAVPALKGDYSVAEGLQRLLRGSGLTYRMDADGTVTLEPVGALQGAVELDTTTVSSQADGRRDLPLEYAGGQVARGARMGMLGNQDMQDVPFSAASYTSELIAERQAQTLGEVLLSDPAVRQSYGFGNFSQVFVIRGFSLASDDIAFNGLYGVLPRQIIGTESVERVEVFKGASAFLTGVSPTGTGVGGAINVVSKKAEDTPTRSLTLDYGSDERVGGSFDIGQRFGEDNRFGVRVNLAKRDGETAIDDEDSEYSLVALGLDYRGERLRLSTDFGYQKQRIDGGRPVIYIPGLAGVPKAPSSTKNYAQSWTWSQLEDTYGMFNAEYDLSENWTAFLAAGGKYSRENGVYSSLYVSNFNGAATVGRLYTPRDEESRSATAGVRGTLSTGPVSHQLNLALSGNWREFRSANEFTGPAGRPGNNLYDPFPINEPNPTSISGDMHDPRKTGSTQARSIAVSDTLGFFDDRVLLTLGLRRQNIVTDSWPAATGLRAPGYAESITTPVYGLVIKPTEYLSLYANRMEGLQPGQVSTASGNRGEIFPPYRSKQIEAGIKLDWGTVGGSLGVYRIEQPQLVTQNNIASVDGEQRNRGVELNLFGEPVDGLRLLAGATLMDTELRGTAGGTNDGNSATGVSEFQYNLGADWEVPGLRGLSLNALMLRTGGQFVDVANRQETPAWTRFDIGTRYTMDLDDKRVVLRAALENLTDKDYWASAATSNGGYLTQGAPRTLKVSATVDF